MIDYLTELCVKGQYSYHVLPSAAGHDSVFFSVEGIPTGILSISIFAFYYMSYILGMIFIRNQNGSHNKEEAMEIDDFLEGCSLLFDYLNNPCKV